MNRTSDEEVAVGVEERDHRRRAVCVVVVKDERGPRLWGSSSIIFAGQGPLFDRKRKLNRPEGSRVKNLKQVGRIGREEVAIVFHMRWWHVVIIGVALGSCFFRPPGFT